MSIRMHLYPDGITGLAAFCDTCHAQITGGDGWVVWNHKDASDWLVVHQSRCDPGGERYGMSMPLDAEIVYLANSSGADLDQARHRIATFAILG